MILKTKGIMGNMPNPNLNNSIFCNLGWCTGRLIQDKSNSTLHIYSPPYYGNESGIEPPECIEIHGHKELIALRDFLNKNLLERE